MIFVFVLVLMADLYERAAKRFGDKVGIDWPGKLEEAYNLDPLPEEFRQKVLRRRYPIFAPKIEEVERHKMPDNWKTYLLAIDPGRDKCGIALLTDAGEIAAKSICKRDRFEDVVKELMGEYKPSRVAVGDGTGSSEIIKILEGMVGEKVAVVKEKGTTLEARELAWREQPPKGYRWLPKIFWPDPADLDAWAAVVIGRRFLERDRP
jgi:RNase H-fold protein (predicted Holliday junction resolvase)